MADNWGMKILLISLFAALGCAGKKEVPRVYFYAHVDNGSTLGISKITFIGGREFVGRYQIAQAIIQKSDNMTIKESAICGDFEMLGATAIADVAGTTRHYGTFYGFYESGYLPDNAPKLAHTQNNPEATYIDNFFQGSASCL